MPSVPVLPSAVFAVLALGAVFGAEFHRPWLLRICKPAATLSLIVVAGWPPIGVVGWLLVGGLAFSTAGDVALLGDNKRTFLAGLALFLVAHFFYGALFLRFAASAVLPFVALSGVAAFSIGLVRRIWPAARGLEVPVIAYAVVITGMVGCAFATAAGPLPRSVGLVGSAGALAFYLSDANLAWRRFRGDYPHAHAVTLAIYWAGQLGIVLFARGAAGW